MENEFKQKHQETIDKLELLKEEVEQAKKESNALKSARKITLTGKKKNPTLI